MKLKASEAEKEALRNAADVESDSSSSDDEEEEAEHEVEENESEDEHSLHVSHIMASEPSENADEV